MEIVVLLPAGLVFLYALYKLIKDDYVFIRKGVSLEQAFDIAFICLWVSLFFSRLLFLLFYLPQGKNLFLEFFSPKYGGFSLVGTIIGGIIGLYVVSKLKRIPLGRLSDFLGLSFLLALPVGFLSSLLVTSKSLLLYFSLNAMLYFMLIIFFVQFLYPKLMSRTLREGSLAIIFLLSFSLISLVTAFLTALKNLPAMMNGQNIVSVLLLLFSVGLLLKQERFFSNNRRALHRQ